MFDAWAITHSFLIWGRTRQETQWRQIRVVVTPCRNLTSGWPLLRGTCTCWSRSLIAVGEQFAQALSVQLSETRVTRDCPVAVVAGRLNDPRLRSAAGGPPEPTPAEVLAHEIGHTIQALRLGPLYLPVVGSLTLFREGPYWWNRFENEASAVGLFGGLVEDHLPLP